MQLPSRENIEKVILENYFEYSYLFQEFQSKFLSGLNSRYQSIENGNLVLYYANQTHHNILRKKDYDFNFDVSLDKFWINLREIQPNQIPIIKIASDTFLPKETVRRKILYLIKKKVLNKKNRKIEWSPNDQYKKNYNINIAKEIEGVARLTGYICKKINLSISSQIVAKELEDKFSFYWFHFLNSQIEYLKVWNKKFNDLELLLITIQIATLVTSKTKEKNHSYKDVNEDSSLIKDIVSASISVNSISDVTGIPRATCVRKLKTLVKLKIVSQDKITKKYYILPDVDSKNFIPKEITLKVVKLFSKLYFICIRGIIFNNSN
tara:strand:- start:719 stop:1684 length:966 start_codon:yes stop_codon:yes gene_type:complete